MTPEWRSRERFEAPRANTVTVWHVPVPSPGPEIDALTPLLSTHERARSKDKRIADRRAEYITGQASLRALLATALGVPASEVRYGRGHKGKPYLHESLELSALQFNITHSGGHVLLALTRGAEIGVDLEWINDRTSCERVARRAFSPSEREATPAFSGSDGRRLFFRIWTAKEAVVKCSGDGIHSGMSRFSVALDATHARVTEARDNQRKVAAYQIVPLPVGERFAATVVYDDRHARELVLRTIEVPALLEGY